MKKEQVRTVVRERYATIAKNENSCCCSPVANLKNTSEQLGYSDEELGSIPEGADLGLGCGNPVALASLKQGEVVLDLGSGGGLDCFLAANKVSETGRVIGVDMTPEMIDKARRNAAKKKYRNVEFRLGEIENLPAADNSVDVIISNCVINLSPDKKRVFQEAFRVLKPKGRLMVSDIVLLKELPQEIKKSVEAYVGCVAGALQKDKYLSQIGNAGFQDVEIVNENIFPMEQIEENPSNSEVIKSLNIPAKRLKEIAESIVSIRVKATKP